MLTATSRRQDLFHTHISEQQQLSHPSQHHHIHMSNQPLSQHQHQQHQHQHQHQHHQQQQQQQHQHQHQQHQHQQQQQQQLQQLQQHQQIQQHQQQQQLHHQQSQQQSILLHESLSLTTASTTRIEEIDRLSVFLTTAPTYEMELSKFLLPTGETISCVLWNELYHITGTDIVRSLVSRFESFGRPVRNIKKFEEGVFSDLRNLKPGADACLEEPKSPFLEMLYRNNCIRTQKKQKVFYWYSVPHDRLFLDAMERDLKREQAGTEPTSQAVAEPALSCTLETVRELVESLSRRTIEMNTITETLQSFTPDGIAPLTRVQPSVTPSAVSPEQSLVESLSTPSGMVAARQDSGSFGDARTGYHLEDGYVFFSYFIALTTTSGELINSTLLLVVPMTIPSQRFLQTQKVPALMPAITPPTPTLVSLGHSHSLKALPRTRSVAEDPRQTLHCSQSLWNVLRSSLQMERTRWATDISTTTTRTVAIATWKRAY